MKSISTDPVLLVKFLAMLGSGLMAGVFFAFSAFVMKALARLPAETGIAAMQAVNVAAVKSWFLVAFLGTTAACGFVVVSTLGGWRDASAMWPLASGLVFLVGTFSVTVLFNVPMNNALAALPANDPGRAAFWVRYVADWTAWNHVRTITSLAAAVLLVAGWMHERKIFSEACPELNSSFVVEMKRNNNTD